MRDIRFRGKDKKTGEWVFGDLVHGCEPQFAYIVERGNKELCRNYIGVDPDTVGQFTGLCDKNGQGIWEGDVIRRWGGECYCGCWEHNGTTVINDMINDCFMMGEGEFLEVIGNTTDSPDLLKEAK